MAPKDPLKFQEHLGEMDGIDYFFQRMLGSQDFEAYFFDIKAQNFNHPTRDPKAKSRIGWYQREARRKVIDMLREGSLRESNGKLIDARPRRSRRRSSDAQDHGHDAGKRQASPPTTTKPVASTSASPVSTRAQARPSWSGSNGLPLGPKNADNRSKPSDSMHDKIEKWSSSTLAATSEAVKPQAEQPPPYAVQPSDVPMIKKESPVQTESADAEPITSELKSSTSKRSIWDDIPGLLDEPAKRQRTEDVSSSKASTDQVNAASKTRLDDDTLLDILITLQKACGQLERDRQALKAEKDAEIAELRKQNDKLEKTVAFLLHTAFPTDPSKVAAASAAAAP